MNYVVRTAGDPSALIESVRAAVRRVDPTVPVTSVATQTEQIERRFQQERLLANAHVALWRPGAAARVDRALRADVVQRLAPDERDRHPHGARRAARQRRRLWSCAGRFCSSDRCGGWRGAWLLLPEVLRSSLPRCCSAPPSGDTCSIAIAVVLILGVSTLASYLPARRASRVDPMVALHRQYKRPRDGCKCWRVARARNKTQKRAGARARSRPL